MRSLPLLLAAQLVGAPFAFAEGPAAPVVETSAAQYVQQAAAHWQKRINPDEAIKAINAAEAALAIDPSNVDALVLISRATYYHAHLLRLGGVDARKALLKKGYEAGARASELAPNNPDALFWKATNLGVYGKLDGIWKSVSSYGEIRETLEKVEAIESSYYHGGVWRYWGRLIDQVPSALRSMHGFDLDDAVGFYQKAVEIEPRYLQSWVYMGECYLQMERPEDARKAFETAAQASASALPSVTAENQIFKAQAAALLKEHFPPAGGAP